MKVSLARQSPVTSTQGSQWLCLLVVWDLSPYEW